MFAAPKKDITQISLNVVLLCLLISPPILKMCGKWQMSDPRRLIVLENFEKKVQFKEAAHEYVQS